MTRRRAALLTLQTALGIVLLLAWLRLVDLGELGQTLGGARPGYVLAAACALLVSGLLRTLRWRLVLQPIVSPGFAELWFILLASNLINFVIPLRTGEVARSVFLRQRRGTSLAASLAAVLVDRAFDLAAVLVIGAVCALTSPTLRAGSGGFLVAGLMLLLAFGALVGTAASGIVPGGRQVPAAVRRVFGETVSQRLLRLADRFRQGLRVVHGRPRAVASMLVMSLATALLDAVAFWGLMRSLGGEAPLLGIVLGYSLLSLTFLIPAAPGYVGSAEVYGSLVLAGVGLSAPLAAGTVVLHHALTSVYLLVTGALGWWGLGLRARELLPDVLRQPEPGDRHEGEGQAE